MLSRVVVAHLHPASLLFLGAVLSYHVTADLCFYSASSCTIVGGCQGAVRFSICVKVFVMHPYPSPLFVQPILFFVVV